jgi:adenylate cyclase class 2
MLEQEVKLAFANVEAARQAVIAAGGRLVVSRRLLDDTLFDTPDGEMRRSGRALRVRRDGAHGALTCKGPVLRSRIKTREEIETRVEDADAAAHILTRLGYVPAFRSQKYREEYAIGDAHIAVDEAPVGVFVEIEGTPEDIARVAVQLGRTEREYRTESYAALWRRACEARGVEPGDMLFDPVDRAR